MTIVPSTELKHYMKLTNRLLNKLSVHCARHSCIVSQHFVTLCGDVAGEWSIMGGVTNARGIRTDVGTIATGYHLSVFIQLWSCWSHSLSARRKQWKLCSPTSQQMTVCAAWKYLINSSLWGKHWYHVGSVEPFILRLQCHEYQFKHFFKRKKKSFLWKKWQSGLRKCEIVQRYCKASPLCSPSRQMTNGTASRPKQWVYTQNGSIS